MFLKKSDIGGYDGDGVKILKKHSFGQIIWNKIEKLSNSWLNQKTLCLKFYFWRGDWALGSGIQILIFAWYFQVPLFVANQLFPKTFILCPGLPDFYFFLLSTSLIMIQVSEKSPNFTPQKKVLLEKTTTNQS